MTPAAISHRDKMATKHAESLKPYLNIELPKADYINGFDEGYEFARKEILDEEKLLKIIREWKHMWMNQRQNSEADYQNYFNRAFGVDSNMIHSLAKMIKDHE